jgi:hypothetical protein
VPPDRIRASRTALFPLKRPKLCPPKTPKVISAGLLPPGVTVADLKRDHQSRLRNPLIAGTAIDGN